MHAPWHLVVPTGAATWPVTRGLAVDLAFVAGFGRERLPLIWGILGSWAEAQARDTVPRPEQGAGESSWWDLPSHPTTLHSTWSHTAHGDEDECASEALRATTCVCAALDLRGCGCEPACTMSTWACTHVHTRIQECIKGTQACWHRCEPCAHSAILALST